MTYGDRVRRGRVLAGSGSLLLTLSLLGCSGPTATQPAPSLSSTKVAVFSSSNEAEASALRAYKSYLAASPKFWATHGRDVTALKNVATDHEIQIEQNTMRSLTSKGLSARGSVALRRFQVQSANLESGAITAYACIDLKRARIVDRANRDVTPAGRVERQTSVVKLSMGPGHLLVKETEPWAGASIC